VGGDAPEGAGEAVLRREVEAWFLRRGIPHFIADYRATEDVFTRALPVLLAVVLVELVGAVDLSWTWWQNTLALAGGAGLVVGAWALINHLRGRPWHQRPDDVGPVELGAFVLLPALLPAVFGAQLGSAIGVAAANLAILGLVYLGASYGLVPMTRWALGQTVRQLSAVVDLFGRALPLLFLFTVTLFINAEVWQVAASLPPALYVTTIAFFVGVGLLFLALRLPTEVARLRRQVRDDDLVAACEGTPVAAEAQALARHEVARVDAVPLTRRQQANVLLVLLFSQAVQVVVITLAIAAFFFAFGLVAVRPEVVAGWLGDTDPVVWSTWALFGSEVEITRALVAVAGFLGTVSGFTFTVYVITDATYRDEFFTAIVGEVHQSLAVRTVYLARLVDPPVGR
jgi:hypothetical protein